MRHEDLEVVRESLRRPPILFKKLNQCTMEKGRFLLIHMDKYVYRFKWLTEAQRYAVSHCRGSYEFYIIVDTEKDEVVNSWSY